MTPRTPHVPAGTLEALSEACPGEALEQAEADAPEESRQFTGMRALWWLDGARWALARWRVASPGCAADESACFNPDCPKHAALTALRDEVDRDWESIWCVDCGVEVDGLGPPICRECADD
jgi:hypothetical protein